MSHEHHSLSEPFADLHVEDGVVHATLLHDPTVEGLEMAIYIDGSSSMREEFSYGRTDADAPAHSEEAPAAPAATPTVNVAHAPKSPPGPPEAKGWLARIFGWFSDSDSDDKHDKHDKHDAPKTLQQSTAARAHARGATAENTNRVEPEVRRMLQYLATKDRNGTLRMAYWACGPKGNNIEAIGELSGRDVERHRFPGPKEMGEATKLGPAILDFIQYFEKRAAHGASQGCAVFITDGQIADRSRVLKLSTEVALRIKAGTLPPVRFVLVGVGELVNETQMAEICDHPYAVEHLWCHRVAAEITHMAEVVSVLVDSSMTVAPGGTVCDEHGRVVKVWRDRLPAVLEFPLPHGARSFTLDINGRRYTQSLPDGDDDDDHHHG